MYTIKLQLTKEEKDELMMALGLRKVEMTERKIKDPNGASVYYEYARMVQRMIRQIERQIKSQS